MTDLVVLTDNFVSDVLGLPVEDLRLGTQHNYTDERGIQHIYVQDTNQIYEMVDGQWVEKAPF